MRLSRLNKLFILKKINAIQLHDLYIIFVCDNFILPVTRVKAHLPTLEIQKKGNVKNTGHA